MAKRPTPPPPPEDAPGELTIVRVGRRARKGNPRADTAGAADWAKGFLEAYRASPSIAQACELMGLSRKTVERRVKADQEFAEALKQADADNVDDIEAAVRSYARNNVATPEGSKLAIFVLKSKRREIYGDRQEINASLDIAVDPKTIAAIAACI